MSLEQLALGSGLDAASLANVETRPEQLATISTVQLRRVAKGLGVAPAELLRDQSGKDQRFENTYRESLRHLRAFARRKELPYRAYADLKKRGWEDLRAAFDASAARGDSASPLSEESWKKLYIDWVSQDQLGSGTSDGSLFDSEI